MAKSKFLSELSLRSVKQEELTLMQLFSKYKCVNNISVDGTFYFAVLVIYLLGCFQPNFSFEQFLHLQISRIKWENAL